MREQGGGEREKDLPEARTRGPAPSDYLGLRDKNERTRLGVPRAFWEV